MQGDDIAASLCHVIEATIPVVRGFHVVERRHRLIHPQPFVLAHGYLDDHLSVKSFKHCVGCSPLQARRRCLLVATWHMAQQAGEVSRIVEQVRM
jgi:hypothetical protein